jgi:hypothetical protein
MKNSTNKMDRAMTSEIHSMRLISLTLALDPTNLEANTPNSSFVIRTIRHSKFSPKNPFFAAQNKSTIE